jgi:hypothetical protein
MKRYCTIVIFFIHYSTSTNAQQNTVTSGGDYSGSNGKISFSIGQIDYLHISNTNGNVNQGVQQPYQILDNSVNESDFDFNLSIGPNPSFDILNIQADFKKMKEVEGYITDQNGKIVKERQKLSIDTTFELGDLASGNYFLNIENQQILLKSYKIIKN